MFGATSPHITDWITSQTSKGLSFRTVAFKPAAIQITGNVAATFYRIGTSSTACRCRNNPEVRLCQAPLT